MYINFASEYSSPIVIHYEAPQVTNTFIGAGVEILVQGEKKFLVTHSAQGEPLVLGRLERCDFNSDIDTDGKHKYYFSP